MPGQPGYIPFSQKPLAEPNYAMGALVGVLLAIACGLGFGFASVAIGFRIPFLTLAIGYINGYAVLKASRVGGSTPAIIACVSALVASGLGLLIMYMASVPFTPLALVIAGYAGYRAYIIADNG